MTGHPSADRTGKRNGSPLPCGGGDPHCIRRRWRRCRGVCIAPRVARHAQKKRLVGYPKRLPHPEVPEHSGALQKPQRSVESSCAARRRVHRRMKGGWASPCRPAIGRYRVRWARPRKSAEVSAVQTECAGNRPSGQIGAGFDRPPDAGTDPANKTQIVFRCWRPREAVSKNRAVIRCAFHLHGRQRMRINTA